MKITKSAYLENINYYGYYKNLLVSQNKNMKQSSFIKMIEAENEIQPHFFHIKPIQYYDQKLQDELETFMTLFKQMNIKASIIKCLQEKYGTIAQVFYTRTMAKENSNLNEYSEWIQKNTDIGFFSRFSFSFLIPYLFMDVNENETILSCGLNNPQICEIICEILKDGYIFINDSDSKSAKSNYKFGYPNYCVLTYPINKIPFIQEFDKILLISPSINDGQNSKDKESKWSLEKTINNHQNQKINLMSALEKVKVGGICVYSTFSINPFENEAVINSVLKNDEFEGKFELVDCSSMFKEIKRKKGLNFWDLNEIKDYTKDKDLLESLSCNSMIKNIEFCMRFYPHQINSIGTFVAVIKKNEQIENFYTKKIDQSDQTNRSHFSNVSQSVIQKIKNDFGFNDDFDKLNFVHYQSLTEKSIFHINQNLMNILNYKNLLEYLHIYRLGTLSFFINDKYQQNPFIPSNQMKPEVIRFPTKRLVYIDMNDYEIMKKTKLLPIDKIIGKKENESILKSNEIGGIYIILDGYGPLIGGILDEQYIEYYCKQETLRKLLKIIKQFQKYNYIRLLKQEKIQNEEIIQLKEANQIQNKEIIQLKEDNQIQNKKIIQLKEDNQIQNKKIIQLKEDNQIQNEEIIQLKEANQIQNKEIIQFKEDSQIQNQTIEELKEAIHKSEEINQKQIKEINGLKETNQNQLKETNDLKEILLQKESKQEDQNKEIEALKETLSKQEETNRNQINEMKNEKYRLRNSDEHFTIGLDCIIGKRKYNKFKEGEFHLKKSSDEGNNNASYILGLLSEKDEHLKKDFENTKSYYEKSFDQGNSNAMIRIGNCYKKGKVVEKNYSKAIECYQKAAELENSQALNCLGLHYWKGIGVEQNHEKALGFFQKAADLNNSDALMYLDSFYNEGKGIKHTYV